MKSNENTLKARSRWVVVPGTDKQADKSVESSAASEDGLSPCPDPIERKTTAIYRLPFLMAPFLAVFSIPIRRL